MAKPNSGKSDIMADFPLQPGQNNIALTRPVNILLHPSRARLSDAKNQGEEHFADAKPGID